MAKIISLNGNFPKANVAASYDRFTILQESAAEMKSLLQLIEQSLENSPKDES